MKYKYILALIVSTLSISTVFSQKIIDEVVVIVGSEMIKESDIQNQFIQMQNSGEKISKCQLLEDLLFQKLLVEQANIDSLPITDADIDSEIKRRIENFTGQEGGLAKLEEFYGKSALEIKTEWRPLVRDQILAQRMQNSIVSEVQVTPNDVKKFYSSLPKDSLPKMPIQYEYAQIVIQPKVTHEEELAIKEKLEGYRQRAIKGENFSKLAVLYSDDLESAKNGGSLGTYMSRAELVPEFSAVAFKLKEGEISKIVKTTFGYHIIQMVELKGEKAKLKHILLRPKTSAESLSIAKNLADSIYTALQDSLTFEKAALRYSADKKTKNNGGIYVNPYTGSSKFQTEAIDPTILYTIKGLKSNDISKPFMSRDDTGVQVYKIVKLIKVTPEHLVSLTEDYDQVKAQALAEKKQKAIEAWVKEKQETIYINFKTDRYSKCDFKYPNWIK